MHVSQLSFFFFFNDTATTEIYTLSLHDALPISVSFSDGGDLEALSDADLVSNHLAAGGGGGSIWLQELFRRHYTKVVTWCLRDRKSTRLNSSHSQISYAVFCLKKKKQMRRHRPR